MIYVLNYVELRKDHPVYFDDFEKYMEEFEGAALKFSSDAIKDANARELYNKNVQRIKAEVVAQHKARKITIRDAAIFCKDMRDMLMAETRARTSAQGLIVAELRKKTPPELVELLDKYAKKKFQKKFEQLNIKQKNRVHYEVVESSARPSVGFNILNKVLIVMGKVFIVYTIAYAIHEILNAEDRKREATKQVLSLSGGFLGAVSGAKTGMPRGPLASFVLTVAGGLAGGLGGTWMADMRYEEEERESDNYVSAGL